MDYRMDMIKGTAALMIQTLVIIPVILPLLLALIQVRVIELKERRMKRLSLPLKEKPS